MISIIMKKRILSLLLTATIVLSLLAITVTSFAETGIDSDGQVYLDEADMNAEFCSQEIEEEAPKEMDLNSEDATLTLLYDDRYSFTDTLGDGCRITDIRTGEVMSYQIVDGSVSEDLDEAVLTKITDTDVIATGTGTAFVTLEDGGGDTMYVTVTVEPANLSLIFLTGQSNMEGFIGNDLYDESAYASSVLCEEGQVYSTYAPTDEHADQVANMIFNNYASSITAADFVAESMTSDFSRSGNELEYKLNSLSSSGQGKTGMDSGLAYEWNQLTHDKVWIVNTAWYGTSIMNWVPGRTYYDRAEAINEQALMTYAAEVEAGHYQKSSILMFWLQGESDRNMSLETYESYFLDMYNGFSISCDLTAFGIISVRASSGSYVNLEDIVMNAPRIAQYSIGANNDYPDIYMVSNVNEQWVTDEGTASYFEMAYPYGISYPTRSGDPLELPTSVTEVHPDIHYLQIGHNENGITAADGMFTALFSDDSASSVIWRGSDGCAVTDLFLFSYLESEIIVPSAEPICLAKTVSYYLEDNTVVSYDLMTATVTYKESGTTNLCATSDRGLIGMIEISTTDETNPGFIYFGNVWYYFDENGAVVPSAVVLDPSGDVYDTGERTWWYIQNSIVMNSYTGFVEDESDWLYVTDGQVNFQQNSVINGTVNGESGWWYVLNGKVQFDYTGVTDCANEYGWWYVKDGMVDFYYTGLATNSYGTWYVNGGQVRFTFNGFAQDEEECWWYLEDGQIRNETCSVIQGSINGTNGWWYVVDGQVQQDFTGACNYGNEYGWWYVKDGMVDFYYTGLATNSYGTWYVNEGQVSFTFNGFAQDEEGCWWYLEDGQIRNETCSVIQGSINGTNGWWYVVDGQVQQDFTGVCNYGNEYGWWYIKKGRVDFSQNGAERNDNGWWYVVDGQVQFNYTGVADYANAYGWWYIKDGKVDFSKTSIEQNQYGWWRVVNGQIDFSCNSVERNDFGWWYIIGGKVNFNYTGVADYANDYGWWYIHDGKVDFDYTGRASNNYGIWYCVNGKVDFSRS